MAPDTDHPEHAREGEHFEHPEHGFGTAPSVDDPIPGLMRSARGSYGDAIRVDLARAGMDDIPRNGTFVLAGMGNWHVEARELVGELGVSKQATSQLLDTLVLRGYLTRSAASEDRRRMTVRLTERGEEAARVIQGAREGVDEELIAMCSAEELRGLRAGLVALATIRARRKSSAG